MVTMTNLSESAVFVQSRSMNENYQADPFTIIKLCQHNEAIIFNNLVSAESYVNVRADWVLFSGVCTTTQTLCRQRI